jgi:glycine cleavage system aminomethyltransferase T
MMYEGYEGRHPIPVSEIDPTREATFSTGVYANAIPGVGAFWAGAFPGVVPMWYTGWRDESLSWHLTCSFHAHLNPSPLVIIRGKDAKRFLSENFVNNIEDFPIGIIKHGIMCLDNGWIAAHGVLMRTGGDEYQSYWHSPFLEYRLSEGRYEVELEDITSQRYLFQLQGPRVLEILEELTGEDLHDIPYRGFRNSAIDGIPVRVLRLGMSGGLAYEIHGPTDLAREHQKRILEVGDPYGIRQLGMASYMLNHTPGGFPQASNNFMSAMPADPGFRAWSAGRAAAAGYDERPPKMDLTGSVGPDPTKHFFNPFELGLGYCVNWDHEFRGRAALAAYVADHPRGAVTLEWDPADLADIYRSQFDRDQEPYVPIDLPGGESVILGHIAQGVDHVLDADGTQIGVSIGRTHSAFHRAMLSLGVLDREFQDIGREVYVLWGEPGTRQKRIRAVVAQFPYNQENANASFDVSAIPRRGAS